MNPKERVYATLSGKPVDRPAAIAVDMGKARDIMGQSQVLLGNVHTVNTVKNGTRSLSRSIPA